MILGSMILGLRSTARMNDREGIVRSDNKDQLDHDSAGRRMVALAGWWCVAIGVAGLAFHLSLAYVWIVLIAFGVAELPRSLWRRALSEQADQRWMIRGVARIGLAAFFRTWA